MTYLDATAFGVEEDGFLREAPHPGAMFQSADEPGERR